ncbi:MAG: Coenzyme F420 hydrogenase/dehydrogenase, beta subunit C-terminal domain [Clostridium sp.]|nr:Coenzyme F420 hydrogenase/dehydrogenase, beta subunit C-terminal domain [Clostridium sp.]
MIEIVKKEDCCGCYGCMNICPKQCIVMKNDDEGFVYPYIDKDKCIECNLCEKVCPTINNLENNDYESKAYACKNKNEVERIKSSSGGIFSVLCQKVINEGGVVFGAAFDKDFTVKHIYAETMDECIRFRGSKYVQSSINDSYKKAKEFLDSGRVVLFSGTQCQIKGLNLYLRKKYENLISVDIVCHGVPSPKVFKNYKNMLVKKYGANIKAINFRDKINGWSDFEFNIKFENKDVYSKSFRSDLYMKGFLSNLYLRPACYSCKSKNFKNNSDISLADYWGVENKHPQFVDKYGVSLIIINSKVGEKVLNSTLNNLDVLNTELDYAIKYNPCIIKAVQSNLNREKFFKKVNYNNIEKSIDKYLKASLSLRVKMKLASLLFAKKKSS